jgi:hypothetical protein
LTRLLQTHKDGQRFYLVIGCFSCSGLFIIVISISCCHGLLFNVICILSCSLSSILNGILSCLSVVWFVFHSVFYIVSQYQSVSLLYFKYSTKVCFVFQIICYLFESLGSYSSIPFMVIEQYWKLSRFSTFSLFFLFIINDLVN